MLQFNRVRASSLAVDRQAFAEMTIARRMLVDSSLLCQDCSNMPMVYATSARQFQLLEVPAFAGMTMPGGIFGRFQPSLESIRFLNLPFSTTKAGTAISLMDICICHTYTLLKVSGVFLEALDACRIPYNIQFHPCVSYNTTPFLHRFHPHLQDQLSFEN